MKSYVICLIFMGLLLTSCGEPDNAYTLFNTNPAESGSRVYVSSFASEKDAKENKKACFKEKLKLEAQKGNKLEYWCEKGDHKS